MPGLGGPGRGAGTARPAARFGDHQAGLGHAAQHRRADAGLTKQIGGQPRFLARQRIQHALPGWGDSHRGQRIGAPVAHDRAGESVETTRSAIAITSPGGDSV